jgi:FkbM family methyltransferase
MNLRDHVLRAAFQAGWQMKIGNRAYKARGYFSSNFVLNVAERHEPHLLAVLERHLPRLDGAFVDVGVNIGQTLFKLISVDPCRRYIGFEPLISCCDDVQRFIDANELTDVEVIPVGLSNENRLAALHVHGRHDPTASLLAQRGTRELRVQVRVGDEALEEIGAGNVAMIKVDVEGTEWQVFDGLRRTLNRDRPILIFEILPNFVGHDRVDVPGEEAQANRHRVELVAKVLSDCGYRINRIHPNGDEEPIASIDLDDKSGYVGSDYTAWPL